MFYLASVMQSTGQLLVPLLPDYNGITQEKEISVAPHPLIKLFFSNSDNVQELLEIFFINCPILAESWKNNMNSLESHVSQLPPKEISDTVQRFVVQLFENLSESEQNKIHGSLYKVLRPQTNDPEWGKHHCFDCIPALIGALEKSQLIESPSPLKVNVWINENNLSQKSCFFELEGKGTQEFREIGYINGIGTDLDTAKSDAGRISDTLCHGLNFSCVYNATHSPTVDMINTLRIFGGNIPKPAIKLLKRWKEFFQKHPNENHKFLQIGFSQGVLMVEVALRLLPLNLRQRIEVIAIAPATFIPTVEGCNVRHFVKKEDIYPNAYAKGRDRLQYDDPDIIIVEHSDTGVNPHNPHCRHYSDAIRPFTESYLYNGSIQLDK